MAETEQERERPSDTDGDTDAGTAGADDQQAGQGAESYGGDTDAAPSVTEQELERGLERDQAEG